MKYPPFCKLFNTGSEKTATNLAKESSVYDRHVLEIYSYEI